MEFTSIVQPHGLLALLESLLGYRTEVMRYVTLTKRHCRCSRSKGLHIMIEFRIIMDFGIGLIDETLGVVWAGDYFRSLAECYDWKETYDNGAFTFNWIYKICLF